MCELFRQPRRAHDEAGPGTAVNRAVYRRLGSLGRAGAWSRETRDGEVKFGTEAALQAKRVRDRVNRYDPIAPACRQFRYLAIATRTDAQRAQLVMEWPDRPK